MPKAREIVDDNFEGSAFVWKGFKENPALSIFGLPLLLLDLVLLPVRLIANRKDYHYQKRTNIRRYYETSPHDSQGASGLEKRRDHGSHYKAPYFNMQMVSPETDFVGELSRTSERESSQASSNNKRNHESVLYPGWRLPHRDFGPGFESSRPSSRGLERASSKFGSRKSSQPSRSQSAYSGSDQNRASEQVHDPYAQSLQGDQDYSDFQPPPQFGLPGSRAPSSANYGPPTVTSDHSSSRRGSSRSAQPTHAPSGGSSGALRDRSARRSLGSHRNGEESERHTELDPDAGLEPWLETVQNSRTPSSSSHHMRSRYKSTLRDDPVAPSDSASQIYARPHPDILYEEPVLEPISERRAEASSCRSRRTARSKSKSGSDHPCFRRGRSRMPPPPQPGARPPTRSPSIRTTNTAELPDAVDGMSRPPSAVPRTRSSRTASARSSRREPIIEEPGSDTGSAHYSNTHEDPQFDLGHDVSSRSGHASRATSRASGPYAGMPSDQCAPPMPGPMPGMQAQDFCMPRSQRTSRYGSTSRSGQSHSRSTGSE